MKRYLSAVPSIKERWSSLEENERTKLFDKSRSQVSEEAHNQSQDRYYVSQLLHAACPEFEDDDLCKRFAGNGIFTMIENLLDGVEDDGTLDSTPLLEKRTKKFLKWIEARGAQESRETNKKMLLIFRNYYLCCFSVAFLRDLCPVLTQGN